MKLFYLHFIVLNDHSQAENSTLNILLEKYAVHFFHSLQDELSSCANTA